MLEMGTEMRLKGAIVMAALVVAVVPLASAPAQAAGCGTLEPFCYQGRHWRIQDLPARVIVVNNSGGLVNSTELLEAVVAAAAAWNAAWSVPGLNQGSCLGKVSGTALCVDPTVLSSPISPTPAGAIQVQFGSLASGTVATTTNRPNPGSHFQHATVILSTNVSWRTQLDPEPHQAGLGEVRTALDGLCPTLLGAVCTPGWYDVQNAVAHELGHALGMEHPQPFLWNSQETMYQYLWQGETGKRTLSHGDLAGLQLVLADSVGHGH